MLVKTVHEHSNGFGSGYVKKKGVEYDVPERIAKNLIDTGMVEEVAEQPVKKRKAKKSA
jgi:hypothetical protein